MQNKLCKIISHGENASKLMWTKEMERKTYHEMVRYRYCGACASSFYLTNQNRGNDPFPESRKIDDLCD